MYASPKPWSFEYSKELEQHVIKDRVGNIICVMNKGVYSPLDATLMELAPEMVEVIALLVKTAETNIQHNEQLLDKAKKLLAKV